MPSLPIPTVYGLARQAGFSHEEAITATAIGTKESSRRPEAVGDAGCSIGIMQINWCAHSKHLPSTAGISSKDGLHDPSANLRAAKVVYDRAGRSWRPWTVYKTGSYLTALPTVRAEVDRALDFDPESQYRRTTPRLSSLIRGFAPTTSVDPITGQALTSLYPGGGITTGSPVGIADKLNPFDRGAGIDDPGLIKRALSAIALALIGFVMVILGLYFLVSSLKPPAPVISLVKAVS